MCDIRVFKLGARKLIDGLRESGELSEKITFRNTKDGTLDPIGMLTGWTWTELYSHCIPGKLVINPAFRPDQIFRATPDVNKNIICMYGTLNSGYGDKAAILQYDLDNEICYVTF